MNITIQKRYLDEALQIAHKAISPKTTLPILSGIKIDATAAGVVVTAQNIELVIQTTIPLELNNLPIVELTQTGSVVLPAKYLTEIIKKMPSDTIEMTLGEKLVTTIRSGKSEVQLVGLDPEEFPQLPNVDRTQSFAIAGGTLRDMITRTIHAASTNETTPILMGLLFESEGDQLIITGCDRHRLAVSRTAIDKRFPQVTLSANNLKELCKVVEDKETVNVYITKEQVLFQAATMSLYSRTLEGTYPDTRRLVTDTCSTEVLVDASELSKAIDRAFLMSREDKSNIVKMVVTPIDLLISSVAQGGKSREAVDAKMTGEPITVSFNSKYMLDALKTLDGTISIKFTEVMKPIILTPEHSTSILQLILPYRTT